MRNHPPGRRGDGPSSLTAVYAALIGNVLVAVTKAGAAAVTGSAGMGSEAVHSFVDCGNEILLLYGIRRSRRAPDAEHPLGYGRELYFYSFIVAVLVFALGAGVSVYQGISHLYHPEPIRHVAVSYGVLALAFLFEGGSWIVSLRQFNAAKGEQGFYRAFRRSKDPPSFMVLFEDSAALLGIAVAAAGTWASVAFHSPLYDALASLLIGAILAVTAALLARESKSLLIGEQADPALMDSILQIAVAEPAIVSAGGLLAVQLAPDQVAVALSLEFQDGATAGDIERQVLALEDKVCRAHPEVITVFIKPQAAEVFESRKQMRDLSAPPDDPPGNPPL
jgi:cation diffusion facilitator family transporter